MRTRELWSIFMLMLAFRTAAGIQPSHLEKSTAINWQFQKWYLQYKDSFSSILDDACQEPYQIYLSRLVNKTRIDWRGGGDDKIALQQPVLECMLAHTSEYIKTSMASAQVLLGLTPTILAFMSPSAQEIALLSNIAERPVLGFMLSLCSPTTHLARLFEYTDPVKQLEDTKGRYKQRRSLRFDCWISIAQYAFAGLAMANLGVLYHQLSVQAVCTWWPDSYGGSFLWGLLNLVAYSGGRRLLAYQLRLAEGYTGGGLPKSVWERYCDRFRRLRRALKNPRKWLPREPRITASRGKICIVALPEGKGFIGWYWGLCLCFLVHLAYGTIFLSSLLFIGPRDALGIVGRFVCSVFVSRVIVSYELAGLCSNEVKIDKAYEECEIGSTDLREG